MTPEEARPHIDRQLDALASAASDGNTTAARQAMEQISDPQGVWSRNYLPHLTDADYSRMNSALTTLQRNTGARTAVDVTSEGISEANATAELSTNAVPQSNGTCPYRDYLYEGELYLHIVNNSEIRELALERQQAAGRITQTQQRLAALNAGAPIETMGRIPTDINRTRTAYENQIEEGLRSHRELSAAFDRQVNAKLKEVQFLFADLAYDLCEKRPVIEELEGRVAPKVNEALAVVNGWTPEQKIAWNNSILAMNSQEIARGGFVQIYSHLELGMFDTDLGSNDAKVFKLFYANCYAEFYGYISGRPRPGENSGVVLEYYTYINAKIELDRIMHRYGKLQTGFDVTTSSELFTAFMRGAFWFSVEELAFFAAAIFTGGSIYALRAAKYVSHGSDASQMGHAARSAITAGRALPHGIHRSTMDELDAAFSFTTGKTALVQGDNGLNVTRTVRTADNASVCRIGCR